MVAWILVWLMNVQPTPAWSQFSVLLLLASFLKGKGALMAPGVLPETAPSACVLYSRRSNSISKSPGPSSPKEPLILSRDISRSESLRSSTSGSQQIFRPCDLIHGEVLGKGFFGQAIKVREPACLPPSSTPRLHVLISSPPSNPKESWR